MTKTLILQTVLCTLFLISCNQQPGEQLAVSKESSTTEAKPIKVNRPFVANIEKAHNKARFLDFDAVQFDIVLNFGGKERLNAKMTLATDGSASKISSRDGNEIVQIGNKVFVSPLYPRPKSARFSAFTWSYFFLFPYKLSDQGTIWEDYPNKDLNGTRYFAEKLSFSPGTGDAPDDWYIAYADTASHLLSKGAYIVTAGASKAEAEEDPHSISYDEYIKVNDIPIANKWSFWAWRKNNGLTDSLGDAELKNIRFLNGGAAAISVDSTFVEVD